MSAAETIRLPDWFNEVNELWYAAVSDGQLEDSDGSERRGDASVQ